MKHLWIRLAAVALIAAAASTGASAASGKKTYAPRGEALPNQVERLLVEKRYDEALKVAEDGLKANGMSVQLRFQRAVVLERMGRAEDAIAAFEEIIRTYPEIPEPYNNLAAIYSQQGKLDRAEELLKKALLMRPDFSTALINLGNLYLVRARENWSRANKIQPSKDLADKISGCDAMLK